MSENPNEYHQVAPGVEGRVMTEEERTERSEASETEAAEEPAAEEPVEEVVE